MMVTIVGVGNRASTMWDSCDVLLAALGKKKREDTIEEWVNKLGILEDCGMLKYKKKKSWKKGLWRLMKNKSGGWLE